MPKARTSIALLLVGHLAACSATFKEISPTPSNGEPSGKAGPFLNSPFFLTITGGLLVGGATQLYNWAKANSERRTAEEKVHLEKQNALLSSVASEIPVYISTMGSMRKLQVWLEDPANKPSDSKNELGRSRDSVLALYTDFYKLTLNTRTATSILVEVGSYFEDKEVCKFVNEENSAIKKIEDAKNETDRNAAAKAEEVVFDSLLAAMADEIRDPIRKAKDPRRRSTWCLRPIVVPLKR
jgi:hypothetical protein